ncbi:uncharacterized protein LOC131944521 [Physella acuta]|uniref:uncharacterized protein LOC131944521 n=1 Tax=Physella acuta TaxID=109671 RepID=UPI0027DC9C99|nr:uncharacterized protein LOC131944521 [Physella acuta]XP_059161178.1 uncharacterized protein LOC131944521 [Physella acuta]XP_059161179.1 uncharacterized protein LOC131944521 [Physella acuta]XP_059161180.1 uncharacterized protein LOC131944521 [Physella acuta]XP_059161181.1 uncharacterized protein LOC131944521 [Physella acuta]
MPKRNNPFGDHSSLQLKTHVGEKEVDKGVAMQTRMQSVYERTHALLFSGMRQMHEVRVELDGNDNEMCIDEQNKFDSSALHKQLYLNKNCKLVPAEDDPMETDIKPSHQVSLVSKDITPESTGLNNQHSCHGFSLPTESGGREYVGHPTKVVSSSNKIPCSEAAPLSANAGSNVFKHMRLAQLKLLSLEKSEALARACHNCRKPVQTRDVIKCQFCEGYVCCQCVRQCRHCHLHFCQLCSVLNYDQSTVRAFCLSCNDEEKSNALLST